MRKILIIVLVGMLPGALIAQAKPARAAAKTAAEPAANLPAAPATLPAPEATKASATTVKTLPAVKVIGEEENLANIPGSGQVIEKKDLESARVFTTTEALRKVSGLNVRDEEGFSLRPNIGIRGLNPTRSTKVLLLEDGIPLSYAPYGDNASYYHPPLERFERIEVLKGAGQLRFGPQTVGGVVNYITPNPPKDPGGKITLTGGNRSYFNGHLSYGGFWGNAGFQVDYTRKQGQGARDNTFSTINDLNLKNVLLAGDKHTLTTKANVYTEDSRVTYSGLTQSEFEQDARQNPFKNDQMTAKRLGGSVQHAWQITPATELVTSLYGAYFTRDWWRQSSNSGQRPNDSADAVNCGGMANLNTTCGNEGRLRNYYTYGVEPRLKSSYNLLGEKQEFNVGLRAHYEIQDRKQMNGDFPLSRTAGTSTNGGLVENNLRLTDAYSGFVDHIFKYKDVSVTPGVRVEHIRLARTNRQIQTVENGGQGVQGNTNLTEVIPGVGLNFNPIDRTTFFAGVHKGFSPPRVEDIINNTTGLSVELSPERSVNYEAGVRTKIIQGISAEATYFRMDFSNQIVAASVAGGAGATLTNGGKTLQQGGEFDLKLATGELLKMKHNFYLITAYTWLPTARFEGTRFSGTTSVSGNRLPYTPEHSITTSVGYSHPIGLDMRIEQVFVGAMLADELNTETPTANGQAGRIPEYAIYNAAINYTYEPWGATLFFTAKNLTDKMYIADRTRGILPGTPRLFQAGVTVKF
ncbi:TonB-dependent receptor family protein [Turneriella parva]|uniref:TonB-dependent receptor n=1 Tax=Turneriella parva (strain ATCC BAA-1111 / DSM 21527 / NCTC 11395 / H) TaxID=869212 RepID=I4B7J6_TURPD|nr:TonB-dependent receptor [Turneriella parva]AFM13253.1 TonB-dependent receptor [Turneriella parva DSM 21527]